LTVKKNKERSCLPLLKYIVDRVIQLDCKTQHKAELHNLTVKKYSM